MIQATVPPRATVLAYHAIAECRPELDVHNLCLSPDAFAKQMEFLARHRRVVRLQDLLRGDVGSGEPAVAITFDDAYRSVYTHAAVLQRHGFPATVFVPTAFVGDRNRWDPPSECPLDIMSAQELQRLSGWGIDLQSHGHAHIDMVESDAAAVEMDLTESRKRLEQLSGRAPDLLAWPFHTGSVASRRVAEHLGFSAAFSIDRPDDGTYALPRVQVAPADGMGLFRLKTSGHYPRLRHSAALYQTYRVIKRVHETHWGSRLP